MSVNLLVASFVSFVPFVAAAQPAVSPPEVTARAETARPQQSTFVEAAVGLGSSTLPHTDVAATLSLGVDHFLGGGVWLHAAASYGDHGEILSHIDGQVLTGRVGATARGCSAGGGACGFAGVDVGMRYAQVSGRTGFFADSGMDVMYDEVEPIVVPRVGLDLGGDRFRVRPAIEVPLAPSGAAVMLSLGLAFGTR